jgi:Flp pilus assembly protein TadB
MPSLLALLITLACGFGALALARASRVRRLSTYRVAVLTNEDLPALGGAGAEEMPVFPPRYRWAVPAGGVLVAGLILWLTRMPVAYAVGGAVLTAALTYLGEMYWADWQAERMEAQLADAIDLMVASLRAGSALSAALEATLAESRQPIREEWEHMVGRMHVGEDPRLVVRELARRVPFESFRLFAHSLLVHWETGGSLAGSLRTVSRTIRDRLEVSRRISAQAVESQVSVAAVMAITYGLTIIMWNTNPVPIQKLLYSQFGSYVACGLMILQSIGMVWIWRMSRIRF